MKHPPTILSKNEPQRPGGTPVVVLPSLATAAQIAAPLQVTSRTITAWAADGTVPVAFRRGKVLRFSPPAVAAALGLSIPEFGALPESTPPATAAKP